MDTIRSRQDPKPPNRRARVVALIFAAWLGFACVQAGPAAHRADEAAKSVAYTWVRHPVSGIELPRVALPKRPAIERAVNQQLDATAADLMCMPEPDPPATPFETQVQVTHAADDVLSVSIRASYYCGGPYPTHDADYSMTFDLVTGKSVAFHELFADYEGDASGIQAMYLASLAPEEFEGCEDVLTVEGLEETRFGYTVSARGLAVQPAFPHVIHACAHPAILDWDRVRALAAPGGIVARVANGAG